MIFRNARNILIFREFYGMMCRHINHIGGINMDLKKIVEDYAIDFIEENSGQLELGLDAPAEEVDQP